MRTRLIEFGKYVIPVIALLVATPAFADETGTAKEQEPDRQTQKRLSRIWKTQQAVEGFDTVEMFSAMESGEIEVLIKTKDAADANVMVTNNSDRPLAIQMPPAFATVPVLGQLGLAGGGGGGGLGGGGLGGGGLGGGGGFGGAGGQQGGGGGFGGGGLGGGGFGGGGGGLGGGGGVFNIPPGRTGKVSVKTFCLEHGKPDPRPSVDYVIRPLEALSKDPAVRELCLMLANDEIAQPVAQAAGWNIANGLSWEFLLHKNRVQLSTGYFERYFTPAQLQVAYRVVQVAKQRAALREGNDDPATQPEKRVSPGEAIGS